MAAIVDSASRKYGASAQTAFGSHRRPRYPVGPKHRNGPESNSSHFDSIALEPSGFATRMRWCFVVGVRARSRRCLTADGTLSLGGLAVTCVLKGVIGECT